ncbi:hypothetical protein D1818_11120 [Aquimarina sp. BL5]|uniref:response regulator receiver domain n=1 Tax=Aquimarina sp. BL5 TaxID=1714860 RepID=UPI000E4A85C8|nr:response regulator receiver domain [Aquimarina sp. BL5]AXT51357.1 hypothetical protein D1818_11120 [Aquimarina sp. BL5]RKN09853.1 hypothetical protein D7036_03530 [Aquimarina sp. BL5]
MTFESIANEVIKRSIRSAVCLDDMFEQPYMTEKGIIERNQELSERDNRKIQLFKDIPEKLYNSFREHGSCDIDIYNFKNIEESWRPDYMLNNKDLLVIDWELEGKGNFESTIEILKQAIESNEYTSVPFIIIYTHLPNEDFKSIIVQLIEQFNPFLNKDIETKRNEFSKNFKSSFEGCFEEEPDEEEIIDWLNENNNLFFEFWNQNAEKFRDETKGRIARSINEKFNTITNKQSKVLTKLKGSLKETFSIELNEGIELLLYLSLETRNNITSFFKRIDSSDLGMKINDSIVTIFSKNTDNGDGVKPEEVFKSFSDLISKDPHNFLTLLSIEMKDKLRDDLSKIGNSISSLNEKAFFHHLQNYQKRSSNPENEFFDFLLKCWMNEVESYNFNNPPTIFNTISSYVETRNYKDLKGHEIKAEIGELGYKLSTVNRESRLLNSPKIGFGDIFKVNYSGDQENQSDEDEYMICITPSCVCVDPTKVNNNFYFIKSENVKEYTKSSAAKDIETNYFSLIKPKSSVWAIKWECKPFSIFIPENNLNNLKSYYCCKPMILEYVTTSKENFTQRIANQSFAYGNSIGIDLPNMKLG